MATTYTIRPISDQLTQSPVVFPADGIYYDKVDEASHDSDTTYIANNVNQTASKDNLFGLGALAVSAGVIDNVLVYVVARKTGGAANQFAYPLIKSGVTTDSGSVSSLGTSYAGRDYTWTTDPNTGLAWTFAAISSLQAGVRITSYGGAGSPQVRVTQVYVDVTVSGRYPTDTLTRVSTIRRTFRPTFYQAEVLTGGLTAMYVSPIAPKRAATPYGTKGYSATDYIAWFNDKLAKGELETVLRIFGHYPTFTEWADWMWSTSGK